MKKVAILMDGGYLIHAFRDVKKRLPYSSEILAVAHSCFDRATEDLFRIYYYDCEPYAGSPFDPRTGNRTDFATSPEYSLRKALYAELSQSETVAFRAGELKFRGWQVKPEAIRSYFQGGKSIDAKAIKPSLQQKGVDIKIGIDIAWLSSQKIVDRIILVTGDTDFIPAMKFARREGVQVVLVSVNDDPKSNMKAHSDIHRRVSI